MTRAVRKAADTAAATKASAALVVPIALRGSAPDPKRVEVTTGPQPPPPTASKNPPTRPSGAGDFHENGLGRAPFQAR